MKLKRHAWCTLLLICALLFIPTSVSAAIPKALRTSLTSITPYVLSETEVAFKWNKVAGKEYTFKVYVSTSEKGPFTYVGSTSSEEESGYISGLVNGTTYYFQIRAYDSDGKYAGKTSVRKINLILPKPQAVKYEIKNKKAVLYWTQVSSGTGYVIYRSTSRSSNYKRVKIITNLTTTSWTDPGVNAGTKYYYKLRTYKKSSGVTRYSASTSAIAVAISDENTSLIVSRNMLQNITSLKQNCTDQEFLEAYNCAVKLMQPLVAYSTKEQLYYIAKILRNMVNSGQVTYSMSEAHYNDPYGYFVKGVASCAGCARATGLCLNILGIPYEHVNENQYSHQWCRVKIGDEYWICDAYGLYVGKEPAPYTHPYLS